MSSTGLKLLVSGGALAFIVGHLIWPALTVDAVTLGLIAIAVLPWLSSLIESVELPGGFKIKLQNLQAAASKVTGGVPATEGAKPTASYLRLKEDDPNLALAGLRIEIETRLRALAQKYGVDVPRASRAAAVGHWR